MNNILKATNLRIGNIIKCPELGDHSHCVTVHDLLEIHYGKHIELYNPLPLTNKWLTKLGFRLQYTSEGNEYWNNDDIEIFGFYDKGFRLLNGEGQWNWDKVYLFVHELQNLQFGLIGKELDIK